MNHFAMTPEDRADVSRERDMQAADQAIRENDLVMSELICEAADIFDANWLTEALTHAFRTGDWAFVQAQAEKHIGPKILEAVENEYERAATAWRAAA